MNRPRTTRWLSTLSLLCCCPVFAATVYKTVDDSGAVSFSDTPPSSDVAVETVVIEAPTPPSSDLTQQRLEDMRTTTDRMVADRMAREKHRAELRQIDAYNYGQTEQQDWIEGYETDTVYTGYQPYPTRRPWRRHHHPQHPIAKPPLRPTAKHSQPSFDYPASLIRKSYNPKVRAAFR